VRDVLRPVVFARERAARARGLVDEAAMGVAEDRDRARVHALRDAELAHGLEDVPRAVNVDAVGLIAAARADPVPRGAVEEALGAGHRAADALAVRDVAQLAAHAERPQIGGAVGVAHERDDRIAGVAETANEPSAEESGRARDEVSRRGSVLPSRRYAQRRHRTERTASQRRSRVRSGPRRTRPARGLPDDARLSGGRAGLGRWRRRRRDLY